MPKRNNIAKRKRLSGDLRVMAVRCGGVFLGVPVAFVEGVAPLPDIVPVPGNRSRVFLGISYVMGQLMSVVDIAPLATGSGTPSAAGDILALRHNGEYYALKITAVEGIAALKPRGSRAKHGALRTLGAGTFKKEKLAVLDVPALIATHVCN